ncbi:MAG: cytochrome c [Gemmatimonadetes bacterium]|nr:cytochrome c [Gemmatimonadota bacterium]
MTNGRIVRAPVRALVSVSALVLTALAQGDAAAQQRRTGEASPTFAVDVAPIFFESCADCHRPGGMAPMSLLNYEAARRYATRIRTQVESRLMPPWHLDRTIGIQEYANDVSLTEDEIATVVAWVDAGAPEGNPADLPPAPRFPTGDVWQLAEEFGPPDLIVRSTPYDVLPESQDQWWMPEVHFEGLDESRYIRAYEFKPSTPGGWRVVHHGHANLVQEGSRGAQLADYGSGKVYQVFPDGMGVLVPAGEASIHWNLHYAPFASDEPVLDDVVEAGVWFYPRGYVPEIVTGGERLFNIDRLGGLAGRGALSRGADIVIPPRGYRVLQGITVLQEPTVVYSFRPHLHARGKEMSMEAIFPDGRRETLIKTNNYRHNWQIGYQFADHARPLLPAGTMLLFTSVFDNTDKNPLNPDPDQWVVFGRAGVHEMSNVWVGMTSLTEAEYERLLSERGRPVAQLDVRDVRR